MTGVPTCLQAEPRQLETYSSPAVGEPNASLPCLLGAGNLGHLKIKYGYMRCQDNQLPDLHGWGEHPKPRESTPSQVGALPSLQEGAGTSEARFRQDPDLALGGVWDFLIAPKDTPMADP